LAPGCERKEDTHETEYISDEPYHRHGGCLYTQERSLPIPTDGGPLERGESVPPLFAVESAMPAETIWREMSDGRSKDQPTCEL